MLIQKPLVLEEGCGMGNCCTGFDAEATKCELRSHGSVSNVEAQTNPLYGKNKTTM